MITALQYGTHCAFAGKTNSRILSSSTRRQRCLFFHRIETPANNKTKPRKFQSMKKNPFYSFSDVSVAISSMIPTFDETKLDLRAKKDKFVYRTVDKMLMALRSTDDLHLPRSTIITHSDTHSSIIHSTIAWSLYQ